MMGNWKIDENIVDNNAIYHLFRKYDNNEIEPFIDYNNENLATIRPNVLRECKSIKSFYTPNVTCVELSAFQNSSIQEYNLRNIVKVMNYAFYNCENYHGDSLNQISFDANYQTKIEIGIYAFNGCNKILNLYANYINIGNHAFGLSLPKNGLENIYINKCDIIGNHAFVNQSNLQNILLWNDSTEYYLNSKINYANNYAFSDCQNLSTIQINNIGHIGNFAFNNCKLSNVNVSCINNVNMYGFNECTELQHLHDITLNTVNGYAFYHCVNFTDITNATLNTIKSNAFWDCPLTNLTDIKLTSIWSNAFYSLPLQKVIINEMTTITNINIFYNCTQLNYIQIDSGTINAAPFQNIGNTELTVNLTNPTCIPIEVGAFKDSVKYFYANDYTGSFNNGIFQDCLTLDTVNLRNSANISNDMFNGCINLHHVTFNGPVYDSAFKNCNFTSDWQDTNVTYIGNEAFYNAFIEDDYSQRQADFLDAITIGNSAFGLVNYNTINLPKVTTVYSESFKDYQGTTLKLPSLFNVPNEMCKYTSNLTDIELNNVRSIGDNAFSELNIVNVNCVNLNNTSYSGLKIGNYAFYNCTDLINVNCHGSAYNFYINVWDYAFYGCNNLTNSFNPNRMYHVGNYAFYNCTNLYMYFDVLKSNSVGDYAFYGCNNLTNITVAQSTVLGDYSFAFSGIVNVSFTGTQNNLLSTVGNFAFANCENLEEITMPYSGVWGEGVFANCTKLSALEIAWTNIPNYTFNGCTSLETMSCTKNLDFIGDEAFKNCTSLTTFNSNYVINIGIDAFYNCKNLVNCSYNLLSNCTYIGENAFKNCEKFNYSPSNENVYIGQYAFDNSGIKSLNYYNISTVSNYSFTNCKQLKNVLFGTKSNQRLKTGVFQNCNQLSSFSNLDARVSYCNQYCCANTGIINLTLNFLNWMGSYAFADCENLKTVYLKSSNSYPTISSYAFYQCKKLTDFTRIYQGTVSNRGECTLGSYCFAHCSNLTNVDLTWDGYSNIIIQSYCFYNTKVSNLTGNACISCIGIYGFYNVKSDIDFMLNRQYYTSISNYTFAKKDIDPQHPEDNATQYNVTLTCNYVTSIGAFAFKNCNQVTLTLPYNQVCTANQNSFNNCNHITVKVNRNQFSNYQTNTPWSTFITHSNFTLMSL